MLHVSKKGKSTPGAVTLVLMPFLGGTTEEWDEVIELLGPDQPTVALDLPGFGKSATVPGYSVEQMADSVEAVLGSLRLGRYILVGHSMAGKVSAVLARRSVDRLPVVADPATGLHAATLYREGAVHVEQLDGLEGLVLVAPSPPSPEPMTESKRDDMMANLADRHDDDLARATKYVTKNESRDLSDAVVKRTAKGVLEMARPAWVAWLQHGSREDWSDRVGVLDLPTLIVAGDKDNSLGPEVQARVTAPHFAHAELKAVHGSSHLIPLERPAELAGMLQEFVARVVAGRPKPEIPPDYLALIASDRLSPKTREVVRSRIPGPKPTEVLTASQMQTLQAVCMRVIPQPPGEEIDLAGTIAAKLATGRGDGWRYAALPPDLEAYRTGLDALASAGFAALPDADKDAALTLLAARKTEPQGRWFEDVRADAVGAYMAHPATLARIGFSGIGVGGANTPHHGFVLVEAGQRESWEPAPQHIAPDGRVVPTIS